MLDTLQQFFTADTSLWSLFIGSLVGATVLPISSEVMLFAVLKAYPDLTWQAVLVATAGNTVGSAITYWMGRLIPHRKPMRYEDKIRKAGPISLVLSWIPLIGDAMVATAGWLRLPFAPCLLWLAVGKLARYAVIAYFV